MCCTSDGKHRIYLSFVRFGRVPSAGVPPFCNLFLGLKSAVYRLEYKSFDPTSPFSETLGIANPVGNTFTIWNTSTIGGMQGILAQVGRRAGQQGGCEVQGLLDNHREAWLGWVTGGSNPRDRSPRAYATCYFDRPVKVVSCLLQFLWLQVLVLEVQTGIEFDRLAAI